MSTVQVIASADGTKIWAESVGDSSKPAVVFIHGFACTSVFFEKQFSDEKLLRCLHLVRYEVRGHGRSGTPETAEAYKSIRHAEDFCAVCEAFSLHKPIVSGWSLGGIVACDITGAYGADYISGIIYMGSFPCWSDYPKLATESISHVAKALMSSDLVEFSKVAIEFADSIVADPSSVPYATKLAWIGGVAVQAPSARTLSFARTQDEHRFLKEGKLLPVLVLQGEKDLHLVSNKAVARMKEVFVNAEIHLLEGVGHAPQYERPEDVNAMILNFVSRVAL